MVTPLSGSDKPRDFPPKFNALLDEVDTKATQEALDNATSGRMPVEDVTAHGAVADGSTDDLAAFTAAIAAEGKVYVPAGDYRMSDGFTIPQGVELHMDADARLIIDAAATNPGVTIATHYSEHIIGTVERNWNGDSWSGGNDAGGSVGVQFHNARFNDVRVHQVKQFTIGLEFHGDGDACTENVVTLGRIWENKRGIAPTTANNGWAHQNTIIGGAIRSTSASGVAGTRLVDFSAHGGGWLLSGVNLEGGHTEYTIELGVGANGNMFHACRYEAVGDGEILVDNGARGNAFVGGRGLKASQIDAGPDSRTHVIAPWTGESAHGAQRMTNVGDPEDGQDAVTKAWAVRTVPPRGLYLPGSASEYAATPDSPPLDVTDLGIRAFLAPDSWRPSDVMAVMSKWRSTGNHRSFYLRVDANGLLRLYWTEDGTLGTLQNLASDTAIPNDGAARAIRVDFDVDDGAGGHVMTFYTSADGLTWDQLGAPQVGTGTTSVFASTAPLEVGLQAGSLFPFVGAIRWVEMLDGETTVASPDFRVPFEPRYRDAQGNVWTLNGTEYSWTGTV